MQGVPSPQPCPPPLFSSSLSASTASSKSLILISIIAFAVLASLSLNLLRHLLSRRRSPSPPPSFFRPHFSDTEHTTSSSSTPPPSDQIHLVPILSLPSPTPVPHKPPDCAVCLSPFRPTDDLRLLPSCRHAFHLQCIDLWLQSTPSCPLCRSPAAPAEEPGASSSFQVEIELSYPFDCSVEHLAEDEVGASADRRSGTDLVKEENGEDGEEGGLQGEITEEGENGGHGWLREYLDRMASSASTSFNSLAFSGRLSSHRFDSGSLESAAAGDGRSWDVEGVEWAEESGLAGIYRWFMGM